ncbi:hypothetical protein [Verrucomicrobium sp. BvORR034]|uniref:hypothetical protein n=1 Tax=Verrucomicrobium sp. BvORR034 TaxID=1396418 RepID=UPI0006790E2E|nr:hypothetical protein [Verrucomicrobium sp. BvORR034]
MFEDLDQIPWASLHHAYGVATDAPTWIRALDSESEDDRTEAIGHFLWSSVFHQSTLYSATPYVIPFVIEALGCPNLASRADGLGKPMKHELMRFLQCCAKAGEPEGRDAGTPTVANAVREGKKTYVRYLEDSDPGMRDTAQWLLKFCELERGSWIWDSGEG